ncbi:MMPL family transporter [Nocardioides salsibiostraticola]
MATPQPTDDVPTAHRAKRSKRWVWPLLVVLVWLFVGGPLGSYSGKLAEVQENDNAAFLPKTAESTQALNTLLEFQETETTPVTLVVERASGLTQADQGTLAAYAEEIAGVDGVVPEATSPPLISEDGESAQLIVQLGVSDGEDILDAVNEIRDLTEAPPEGLTVLVGGQGGILADFVNAFGAIDGILLLVALAVVLLILVVVYRTPVLPFTVLISAVLGLGVSSAIIYALATNDVLDVNGQSQAILFILAIGAATDYALLLVARYREELRDHESPYVAMKVAYRAVLEPVLASGVTVILGLLCLLLSDLSSLAGLGPVGAIGVAGAMLVSLTLLPAALLLLGRRAFWPFMPAYGSPHRDKQGIWGRVSGLIKTRSAVVAVATGVVLAVFGGFAFTLNEEPVPQTELFLTPEDSVDAQEILDDHFEADNSSPAQIVVPESSLPRALETITGTEGIAAEAAAGRPAVFPIPDETDPSSAKIVDGDAIIFASFADPADSAAATDTLERLRENLRELDGDILVGGSTAILFDTRETTSRDRLVVIPAILLVILLVLMLLLRSVVAPVLIILANVLSFGATIGISALVFTYLFGFPASDPSTLLIAFVFLVALGIDYSIFLMTRVREESLRRGTHEGVLKGLSVTGGVITSAGVVLAATFAALSVVPILFLAQTAFIVAFGVLLDTLVVRSLLVPAIAYQLGDRTWWPSRMPEPSSPTETPEPARN